MIWEVKIDKDTVFLDSKKFYTGEENPNNEEKLVRKAVGLPVTKQLVYYTDTYDKESVVCIKQYQVTEMYDETDNWYVIEATLADNSKVKIHSSYLAEMQKPSFVADMVAQMKKG